MKQLCEKAGFKGKFTNHSLMVSALCMYQLHVSEKCVKEIAGFCSDCQNLQIREHLIISNTRLVDLPLCLVKSSWMLLKRIENNQVDMETEECKSELIDNFLNESDRKHSVLLQQEWR